MHEGAMVESLIGLVRQHLPSSHRLIGLTVGAESAAAIVPECLQTWWHELTTGTDLAGSTLTLAVRPPVDIGDGHRQSGNGIWLEQMEVEEPD